MNGSPCHFGLLKNKNKRAECEGEGRGGGEEVTSITQGGEARAAAWGLRPP